MASNIEDVIINLLIKNPNLAASVSGIKDFAGQVSAVIELAKTLGKEYGVAADQVLSAINTINKSSKEMNITPMTLPGVTIEAKEVMMKEVTSKKILQINTQRIAKEKEMELSRIKTVEAAWDDYYGGIIAQENKVAVARQKTLALLTVEANKQRISEAVAGKSPYQQTQALVKLMNELHKETGAATNEMLKLAQAEHGIDPTVIKNTNNQLHFMKNSLVDNIKELFNMKAIMNTLFGVGMAMLVFQLQMAVSQFFATAIQQAKDFANAMANLRVGEEILSSKGVKITGKEIMKVLDDLDKRIQFISRIGLAKGLGSALNQLSGFGITSGQAGKLVEVAAIVKLKSPDKDIADIVANITNGVLTGTSEATKNIGLQFDDLNVKAKAKQLGLINETNDKLTEQIKIQARLGIAVDFANEKLGASIAQADKQTMMLAQADKLYQNISLTLGQLILPLLADAADSTKGWLGYINEALETLKQLTVIREYTSKINAGSSFGAETAYTVEEKAKIWKDIMDKYFPTIGDTPTGIPPLTADNTDLTGENADKIKSALLGLVKDMENFADKARYMAEDFAKSMSDMAAANALEMQRFQQDWGIDRQQIIDEAEKSIANKQVDYNKKKVDAEAKLAEDLRQLREKYLMSLDDALHSRDARQILRLTREYGMNKQNLLNEFELKQKTDDRTHKQELKDLEKQKRDRLKILDAERTLKMKRMQEDYDIRKKKAEYEHTLEMQRLLHDRDDRLREVATSLGDQMDLTDEGMRGLYKIFSNFFGPDGVLGDLFKYTYDQGLYYLTAMLNAMKTLPTPSGGGGSGGKRTKIPMAKGGLNILNSPTTFNAGEGGVPEAHLFVPLNQLSSMSGMLGSAFGGSGGGGRMELLVSLSPDLETRVVKKSLDEISNVVMNVRRNQR